MYAGIIRITNTIMPSINDRLIRIIQRGIMMKIIEQPQPVLDSQKNYRLKSRILAVALYKKCSRSPSIMPTTTIKRIKSGMPIIKKIGIKITLTINGTFKIIARFANWHGNTKYA